MERFIKGELSDASEHRAAEIQKRRINYGTDDR